VLGSGARHVAFVGDPAASPDVAERWAGLERAARSAQGVTLDVVPPAGFSEVDGADVVRADLDADRLPDAYVCANDELALGVMSALAAAGIRVPERVQVTGWDDVMAARYAGLTTVRQPMRELGATAAALLDEQITGTRTEPRHVVLPTQLVIRTSTSRKDT
jgi:LacI family transcriptional regulator